MSAEHNKEPKWDRYTAFDREIDALVKSRFTARRMNAVKWRSVLEAMDHVAVKYTVKLVFEGSPIQLTSVWLPFEGSQYFDTTPYGPFKTKAIEWMEIEPDPKAAENLIPATASELGDRLDRANVPFETLRLSIRIRGYV